MGVGEKICAFLNSGGGQNLVGVRDDATVEGSVNADQIERMLRPLSGGDSAVSLITPNAIWDVTEEPTDDGPVVLIDVPSGTDLPYLFKDSIYIRTGQKTSRIWMMRRSLRPYALLRTSAVGGFVILMTSPWSWKI